MAPLFSLALILLVLSSAAASPARAQSIKSARLLDLLIRDYTFKSFKLKRCRTGAIRPVHLPSNLSGIDVHSSRFRCGSLSRYGAELNEFRLGTGVIAQPCVERVMLVRQNLGYNWSSIYYANYDLSGYQLVSPVLGLLAYNGDGNFSNFYELGLSATDKHIIIDFHNFTVDLFRRETPGIRPLCATFSRDGKVALKKEESPNVCVTNKQGHFGLVIESPPSLPGRGKVNRWRLAVVSGIGATFAAFLLALLLVAMLVKVKRKAEMEELERRAYEEEALRVSMVGHIRAPTADVTRTSPSAIEHHECIQTS